MPDLVTATVAGSESHHSRMSRATLRRAPLQHAVAAAHTRLASATTAPTLPPPSPVATASGLPRSVRQRPRRARIRPPPTTTKRLQPSCSIGSPQPPRAPTERRRRTRGTG
ncbi:unnamed protein product [Urochloa humidicola]